MGRFACRRPGFPLYLLRRMPLQSGNAKYMGNAHIFLNVFRIKDNLLEYFTIWKIGMKNRFLAHL